MRILLADDDAATCDFVARALDGDGHEVLIASDGAEALAIFKATEGLDMLVSDISMPGMDGLALASEALAAAPQLRIILMSALDAELARAGALSGAHVTTLSKPFTLDEMRAAVRALTV